jgi:hypothetical protein
MEENREHEGVRSNPCETLVAKMAKQGFMWYWTVNVTSGCLAISGIGAGKDWCEQKLSRFVNHELNICLFTMEYYVNGELNHHHFLADVEKHWGGTWTPTSEESEEVAVAVPI